MTLSSFAARAEVRAALLSTLLVLSSSCSGGGGDSNAIAAYQTTNTRFAVAASVPLAFSGDRLAFLADEASSGAQDLNGDGEVVDEVAVVVNLVTREETSLGVAATTLAWVDDHLFLVVDEVFDGRDWGGAVNTTDLVLLRWQEGFDEPLFYDVLDRGSDPAILASGDTLFYASATPGAGSLETSLVAVSSALPGQRREVLSHDSVGALAPRILGTDEGLVFLALDEEVEGRDLNGDGDSTDNTVLALLDGTGEAAETGYTKTVRSTGLALSGSDSPYRASWADTGEWLVGFLVDEASQGATNLNLFDGNTLPASWQVVGCADDADAEDEVLHVLDFADWDANPAAAPPQNTGVVGADRVLIVGDVVATISVETDDASCALNGDGDSEDRVLRWFRTDGSGPSTSTTQLIALDAALPGPALAVAELDGFLVVQCDEEADGRDHDGSPGSQRDLLAWIDPRAPSPTWQFDHGSTGESHATATWMGELPGKSRLGLAFAESSNAVDLNLDGDQLDSMATFATFTGTSPRLAFPGFAVAVVSNQAGISLTGNMGYYRLSEAEEGRDLNGNGTEDDVLLARSELTTGTSFNMGALNTLPREAVESDFYGGAGAAYLFDESIIGSDLSGDGDANDLTVRHFTFQ